MRLACLVPRLVPRVVLTLALALAGSAAVLLGPGGASSATGSHPQPRGDTIVEVTGTRADGFEIHHYDGSSLFPPTGSEARAECSEYDTEVERVRCTTEVRVWYRDLGDLKRALRWARHTS